MSGPLHQRWARLVPGTLSRDKSTTLLLLLSSLMVLAPHASHLPPWISVSVAATLLWRAALTWRGARLPPLRLLLPISLLAMAGVYASFKTLLGRDAGVAMLSLLLAFKLLEMHARRDLFVVIFLSFFLLLSNFFYSQSIGMALAMSVTLVVLLTAQLSFQYGATLPPLGRRLRLGALICVLAAPLALLLLVAFPRIQGPLWGLPGDAHSGRSGLSDSMAPGTMSNLALSGETAFRVRFDGAPPPQRSLYWRGVVLGDYDGRTWTRIGAKRRPRRLGEVFAPGAVNAELNGPALDYQVTLEAHGGRWIYALDLPRQVDRLDGNPYAVSAQLELMTLNPIAGRIRYQASSVLEYRLQADVDIAQLQPWLNLPAGFNPRTLAWAATLGRADDPAAAVRAVLKAFREENFSYTLEPPLLGRDAVDQFLFDSKAGFCEHYAGAFVVLMRAIGIPARVVTGYQGGELNPIDGYLTVRQSDAHAWAEVWLPKRGWLRIDPTAAVAPERVAQNLARALPRPAPFGLQGLSELIFQDGKNAWWSALRFNMNAVNNAWNQWVLDYTPERQRGVLHDLGALLGKVSTGLALAALGALLYLALRWRARRRRDPLAALYDAFCQQQARRGYRRAPDEGPLRYGARLDAGDTDAAPEKRAARTRFLAIYGAIKYGNASAQDTAVSLRTLKRLLTDTR